MAQALVVLAGSGGSQDLDTYRTMTF